MGPLRIFVAKSFWHQDEAKTRPIECFLKTFAPNGVTWCTAEAAEAESVSVKVRSKIDESDVFIGIFTRRYPILVGGNGRLRDLWQLATSKMERWSAPPWVLQELGYAIGVRKKLVLFLENGVDIGNLQGDLEYIPYEPSAPSEAFTRASWMLNKFLAGQLGISVETSVSLASAISGAAEIPTDVISDSVAVTQEPKLDRSFEQLKEALGKRDWDAAKRAFEHGLEIAGQEDARAALLWELWYQLQKFKKGCAGALDRMLALQSAQPQEAWIPQFIGEGMMHSGEYGRAREFFRKSASLSKDIEEQLLLFRREAKCYELDRKFRNAVDLLLRVLRSEPVKRIEFLNQLSETYRALGDKHAAFCIAEASLVSNLAQDDVRFALGLEYDKLGHKELFLHHYKVLLSHDGDNCSVINNLGLAYERCNLDVRAVEYYKEALKLGETISASNLSSKYLQSGFGDEAHDILRKVIDGPRCEPAVAHALAAISVKREEEAKAERTLLDIAEQHRAFFSGYGRALVESSLLAIDGTWIFPFGLVTLTLKGASLSGHGEVEDPISIGSARRLIGMKSESTHYVDEYALDGSAEGLACRFTLVWTSTNSAWQALAGHSEKTGYLVFDKDSLHAEVAEVEDGFVRKIYSIERRLV